MVGFGGLVEDGWVATGPVDVVGVKRVVISIVGKSGAVDLVGVDMVADVTKIEIFYIIGRYLTGQLLVTL